MQERINIKKWEENNIEILENFKEVSFEGLKLIFRSSLIVVNLMAYIFWKATIFIKNFLIQMLIGPQLVKHIAPDKEPELISTFESGKFNNLWRG